MKNQVYCGQYAFYRLCLERKIKEEELQKIFESLPFSKECSFMDFKQWANKLGRIGEGLKTKNPELFVPFIAHLDLFEYWHFVVVVHYGVWVIYYDVDNHKHRIPRWLFNFAFKGKIFIIL